MQEIIQVENDFTNSYINAIGHFGITIRLNLKESLAAHPFT